jgi:hypothetical protein
VGEKVPGPLPVPLQFHHEGWEKTRQNVFYRIPDLRDVEDFCIVYAKSAMDDEPVRVGKGLEPPLPALDGTGVGGSGLLKNSSLLSSAVDAPYLFHHVLGRRWRAGITVTPNFRPRLCPKGKGDKGWEAP